MKIKMAISLKKFSDRCFFVLLFGFLLPAVLTKNIPDPNLTNKTASNCTLKQFQCGNGTCVPYSWLCDGHNDCAGGEDEKLTMCSSLNSCEQNEFTCGNGVCIPKEWKCDKERDCGDGSDEETEKCWNHSCGEDEFTCTSGFNDCIPKSWKCDGHNDCEDGSDEKGCAPACGKDEFKCDNGNCVQGHLKCNSFNDCGDNSDEKDCPLKSCSPETEFTCNDGYCISKAWRCDGDFDCPDNSDELNCNKTTTATLDCNINPLLCLNDKHCLQQPWICDGTKDCPNGVDESPLLCQNSTTSCPKDNFQCSDGSCVPAHLRCSGSIDCPDGSDEMGCTTSNNCESKTHFDCGNNLCIPLAEVCAHQQICPNFGEEQKNLCRKSNCKEINHGCSQKCVDTTNGYRCECEAGYKLTNGKNCVDIDECKVPGVCSHICINTIGSYSCACEDGYVPDRKDPTKCVALGEKSILLVTSRDIRNITLSEQTKSKVIVNQVIAPKALDYAFSDGLLFWSDVRLKGIFKVATNQTGTKSLIINDVSTESLAVDWAHKAIYWTDYEKGTIEMADFNGGNRRVLIAGLDSPRAIAVDPIDGWIFWTDWGNNPKIEKAGLDASHRQTIVLTRISWPNGITIDLKEKRIYWVDAKLHQIFSSDYNGKSRRVVLSSEIYLRHPFSTVTFEDWVYWADWDKAAIYRVHKYNSKQIETISPLELFENPMGLRMYHPYMQPSVKNHCEDLQCSYFCMPKPKVDENSPLASCICPDEFVLQADGRSCATRATTKPVEVTTTKTSTTETTTKITVTPSTKKESDLDDVKEVDHSINTDPIFVTWMVILVIIIGACGGFMIYVWRKCLYREKMAISFKTQPIDRKKVTNSFFVDQDVFEPLNGHKLKETV